LPQTPQFFTSRVVSTHAPLQQSWPGAQVTPTAPQFVVVLTAMQTPLEQPWPGAHTWPQAPQLATSAFKRAQYAVPVREVQALYPALHAMPQLPLVQVAVPNLGMGQGLSHAPQDIGLFIRSVQLPPVASVQQIRPGAQVVPQPPQLPAVLSAVQVPLQQPQNTGQWLKQLPQKPGSDWRSVQRPPQQVLPAAQVVLPQGTPGGEEHWPLTQLSPC
jgi:hypothetical protein